MSWARPLVESWERNYLPLSPDDIEQRSIERKVSAIGGNSCGTLGIRADSERNPSNLTDGWPAICNLVGATWRDTRILVCGFSRRILQTNYFVLTRPPQPSTSISRRVGTGHPSSLPTRHANSNLP